MVNEEETKSRKLPPKSLWLLAVACAVPVLLVLWVYSAYTAGWRSNPGHETILEQHVSPDGVIEARISYHDWGAMRQSIYMVKLVLVADEDEWESVRWLRRTVGHFEVAWTDKRSLSIIVHQAREKYVPLGEWDLVTGHFKTGQSWSFQNRPLLSPQLDDVVGWGLSLQARSLSL